MKPRLFVAAFFAWLGFFLALGGTAASFQQQSCGDQECVDCHVLTKDEAKGILGNMVDGVIDVNVSEVKGLWVVDVVKASRKVPVYIDFSKNYVFSGDLIRIGTRENLTNSRFLSLNTVDLSLIPLEDALVLGKPSAGKRIIVFDDPECPFCQKLFAEMKEVVSRDGEVAFYIKMLPLKIHPNAVEKAKSIVCAKSLQMLEDSLNGKPIPPPSCQTDEIENNAKLAQQLNIVSVPTLVYPNGLVLPGFARADNILQILGQGRTAGDGKAGE